MFCIVREIRWGLHMFVYVHEQCNHTESDNIESYVLEQWYSIFHIISDSIDLQDYVQQWNIGILPTGTLTSFSTLFLLSEQKRTLGLSSVKNSESCALSRTNSCYSVHVLTGCKCSHKPENAWSSLSRFNTNIKQYLWSPICLTSIIRICIWVPEEHFLTFRTIVPLLTHLSTLCLCSQVHVKEKYT